MHGWLSIYCKDCIIKKLLAMNPLQRSPGSGLDVGTGPIKLTEDGLLVSDVEVGAAQLDSSMVKLTGSTLRANGTLLILASSKNDIGYIGYSPKNDENDG